MANTHTDTRSTRILLAAAAITREQLERSDEQHPGTSANELSEKLLLNRANVSKELNRLYRDGQLIKLQGKPTLYLHRETLCARYPAVFFPTTIPLGHSIDEYIASVLPEAPAERTAPTRLENTIGVHGSLSRVVERARAAVAYPPSGLHTIIVGNSGVGKLRFARILYLHGIEIGRFPPDSEPIVFNCQEMSGSVNLLIGQLFGCGKGALPGVDKSRRGLIEQAAGGMLILDGIHKLPLRVQELLTTLIEKNTFTRLGESSLQRQAELMLVASTTEPMDSPCIDKLVRNFPVVLQLPNLDERSPAEILEHLLMFFSREATATGLTFSIHRDVLACLAAASYPGNIGEMKGVVKTTASAAFLESTCRKDRQGTVEIGLRHLPEQVMQSVLADSMKPLEIQSYLGDVQNASILFRPGEAATLPESAHASAELGSLESVMAELDNDPSEETVDSYINRCVSCLQAAGSRRNLLLQSKINPALEEVARRALLPFAECRAIIVNNELLYSLLLHLDSVIRRLQEGQLAIGRSGEGTLRLSSPNQHQAAVELVLALEQAFNITMSQEDIDFITMYLYLAAKWSSARRVALLVVAHGNGVASGIASILRKTCSTDGIYSVCFAPEMSMDQLLTRVTEVASSINQGNGVLLLTDMEPLCSLHLHLQRQCGFPCETLSGLNLPEMIDVSQKAVKQGYNLQSLVKECRHHSEPASTTAAPVADTFIDRIINEILSTSLTFINPAKAADSLLLTLDGLLPELGLTYSDEIAIKFIFHCSHMLERVICNQPLEHPKLRSFINSYSDLMLSVEKRLSYPAEVFGVSIPACELAYVCEIFIPCLEKAGVIAPMR